MTAKELRADVPALQKDVYLNFGAHGPSPRHVVDAVQVPGQLSMNIAEGDADVVAI